MPEAVEDGFTQVKLKLGGSLEDDLRRRKIARDAVIRAATFAREPTS